MIGVGIGIGISRHKVAQEIESEINIVTDVVVVSALAEAPPPVISNAQTVSLLSVTASGTTEALCPSVSGFQNVTVTSPVANSSSTAKVPSITVMPILDSFNRADSATSLGVADTGQTWLSPLNHTFGIQSNQAYVASGTGWGITWLNSLMADYSLECALQWYSGTSAVLVFRSDGTNANRWTFTIADTGDRIVIAKRVGNVETEMHSTSFAPVSGTWYDVKVECVGTTIKYYLNGILRGTITDSSLSTMTYVGLAAYRLQAIPQTRWDGFKVSGVVAVVDPVLVSDTFNRTNNATSLGVADTGQAWVMGNQSLGISDNRAYSSYPTQGYNYPNNSIDVGVSDVSISANIYSASNNAAIIRARIVDEDNYLVAEINQLGTLNVIKQINNVNTTIASKTVSFVTGALLRIDCKGTSIKVFYNDTLHFDLVETTLVNGTKHGLAIWDNNQTYFDNFKIEAI